MKDVVILNGPPGSGKDQCADFLCSNARNVNLMMYKDKLFELVLAIYNIDAIDFFNLYDNRETKEVPTPLLMGESPRSAMIKVSEEVIKPVYGKDYFGKAASENLVDNMVNVFSDGGFLEELEPVYEECDGIMLIVRIHRPGYTFEGDSRSYINMFKDVNIIDVNNDGSLEDLEFDIVQAVKSEMNLQEIGE